MSEAGGGSPGAPYDRISGAYDLIAEHLARDQGLAPLDARPGERVLEIGSGTGRALVTLARAVGLRGMVCGLDSSARVLDLSRGWVAHCPRHVHLQQGPCGVCAVYENKEEGTGPWGPVPFLQTI